MSRKLKDVLTVAYIFLLVLAILIIVYFKVKYLLKIIKQ